MKNKYPTRNSNEIVTSLAALDILESLISSVTSLVVLDLSNVFVGLVL